MKQVGACLLGITALQAASDLNRGRRAGCWGLLALLLLGDMALAQEGVREHLRQRWWAQRQQQAAAPNQAQRPGLLAPGDHVFEIQHQGLRRTYGVHVPQGLVPGRPGPVVLAFHGGGGNWRLQADDEKYGLISQSEATGYVLVFPNGYSRFPGGQLATWNAGRCCGEARDQQVDDVGFVAALLRDLRQRLAVDPGRVYAIGMSNGAMMAYRLACEMADTFAGIAAVAGTDNTTRCAPARPLRVLHLHARDDDHVLFAGGAGPQAFRDQGKVTEFTSVPETVARWRGHNQCGPSPRRTLQVPGAYCERYEGCAAGAAVQLCVTETGGHSWPGGGQTRRGKAPPSAAMNANQVIWSFFAGD